MKNFHEDIKQQNKQKKIKLAESKQEVNKFYSRERLKMGIWIMSFEGGGIRHNPVDFEELNFMCDLPKTFFNIKLYMIVKQHQSNFIDFQNFHKNQPNLRMIYFINDVQCYKY